MVDTQSMSVQIYELLLDYFTNEELAMGLSVDTL